MSKRSGKKLPRKLVLAIIALVVVGGFAISFIQAAIKAQPTMTVSVSDSKYSPGVDQAFIKGSEYRFVTVTFALKNIGKKAVNVVPAEAYLSDKDGARYGQATHNDKTPFQAGAIEPGSSKTGQLTYQIPNNVHELSFHVDVPDALVKFETPIKPKS
jgi:hypothetical protein